MVELNTKMEADIGIDFKFLVSKKENGLGENYAYIKDISEVMAYNYDASLLTSIMEEKLLSKSEDERYCAANILGLIGLRLIYVMSETKKDNMKLIEEIFSKLEEVYKSEKDPFVRNILQYYLLIKRSSSSFYEITHKT
jgi:hypothetical protein